MQTSALILSLLVALAGAAHAETPCERDKPQE